jgi:spermidine synthase
VRFFFALTLFLSAGLVFLFQPMCAKMLLPSLGGVPAVWNTCMVFFQAGLLAGYAYAHAGPRLFGRPLHAPVHLGLMLLPFLVLPIALGQRTPPADASPVSWLLSTLVLSAGLPFFVVASSAPLLQSWFAATAQPGARDPYFLYAASNLGSLAALFSYPFFVEPNLVLSQQSLWWTVGYGTLVLFTGACSLVLWKSRNQHAIVVGDRNSFRSPSLPEERGMNSVLRIRWVLLALIPSSLLLSVTSYLTTDIASIPLFWIIPLGLYLLTFILVFSNRFPRLPGFFRGGLPLVVMLLVLALLSEATEPLILVFGLHLAGFFWIAMACHAELARTRPAVEHLTEYYLWLALGGVLGGMFNALLAPVIFNTVAEYPLMLVLACLLVGVRKRRSAGAPQRPLPLLLDLVLPVFLGFLTMALVLAGQYYELEPGPISVAGMFSAPVLICYTFIERPLRFGLGLGAILLASAFYSGIHGRILVRQRSFFGVLRVTDKEDYRFLIHGNTVHGQQSLDPKRQTEPLTYYHHGSPIGQIFRVFRGDSRLDHVALIGLGTGALASYSEKDQTWTFFEIDPAVVAIAQNPKWFTYLQQARGNIQVVIGDGRLGLAKSADSFGLIVVDAFNSDAIPIHLLTREALAIYRSRLQKGGILAFHISNRHLDLEPVLANLAKDAGMACLVERDTHIIPRGRWASDWMVLANTRADLKQLERTRRWDLGQTEDSLAVWTDDFSNLLDVFRRRSLDLDED